MAYLANFITGLRVLSIPLLALFFKTQKLWATLILFICASLTDGLDGYLARYFQQVSAFGVWLDPVADKLMIVSMLILLVTDPIYHHLTFPVLMMVSRELIVSALREWMAICHQHTSVQVSYLGKWKTAAQMLSIGLLLLAKIYSKKYWISSVGQAVFYIALCLTMISLADYTVSAYKAMS